MARDYKKIRAWQLADELAIAVYRVTSEFPNTEIYGLTSQMRRAAVSVAANIVEGSARKHTNEYIHFLYTAMGSLAELGYFIELSLKLDYIQNGNSSDLKSLHSHTTKTLQALINFIEKSKVEGQRTKV
jgi:four helix bundle protein